MQPTCAASVNKPKLLTEIVSKIMAGAPSARNVKQSSSCLVEDETEITSFDLLESTQFPEPCTCKKIEVSLDESELKELLSERPNKT